MKQPTAAKDWLRLLPCDGQVTIFQCFHRTWPGIIQSSSASKWIRQRLTHS